MKTYSEKLKDPRWQRKRLEIMERDEFACRYCRSKTETLNVHHKLYRKGKAPWDYEDDVFVTLCHGCHKVAEESKESVLLMMGANKYRDREIALIGAALTEKPRDLTSLGWAATSLAGCVNAQMSIMADDTADSELRANMTEEFKNNMADTIENLHSALFHLRKKFPEL